MILLIEPFCGAAGDMIAGALLGLKGIDQCKFMDSLQSLPLQEEWDISLDKVERHSIAANHFNVKIDGDNHKTDHHHRTLPEIFKIIDGAEAIYDTVKAKAKAVFAKLAEAEAEVHGKETDAVHFHEVGAADAIIDITAVCLALEMLEVEKIYALPLPLGTGSVKTAHGVLPVPVPATVILLRNIPVFRTGIQSELVTPTGAALLSVLVDSWEPPLSGRSIDSSYGAGTRDLKDRASVLRVSLYNDCEDGRETKDKVTVIECNIDDMPGETFSWLFPRIMDAGALDFAVIPATMKKGRPGFILQLICVPEKTAEFAEFLLRETTTLGVRYRTEERIKLKREIRRLDTPYGEISAKFAEDGGGNIIKVKAEYEEIAKFAELHNKSFLEMEAEINSLLRAEAGKSKHDSI